ncbi:hypothetical protein BN946_scf184912.g23 [Trametes cinnabarina]|uniref:Uncharacterized protein n=1 Tax=Pycnoporus cinnabarinus TaxID=5643 RepID=A0A060SZ27_PYCCI|nr:hypothetical protein BN946_scf184912.g23 [Trametes cinnabarina]
MPAKRKGLDSESDVHAAKKIHSTTLAPVGDIANIAAKDSGVAHPSVIEGTQPCSASPLSNTASSAEDHDGPSPGSPDWIISPSNANYPVSFLERLREFFSFSDPDTERYYISNAPGDVSWGTGDYERYLCHGSPLRPVLVWIVGEVSKDYFLCVPGGNPSKSISLNLAPVRDSDRLAAQRMLQTCQTYNGDTGNPETVRLSRKTSSINRTKKVTAYLFEDVFDARVRFRPKHEMARFSVTECDEDGKVAYNRKDWQRFRASYELRYLSLLRMGDDVSEQGMAAPDVDDSRTKCI